MPAKILIVEDEAIVALDLQRRLIGMGYDVPHIAATHDRALSAADEIKPDVVLMDIHIAGKKDGIETAKKMLAPVIYLTAYAEEKTLARARETKPYGYLIKPFSERELHATIQMTLERNRHDQELNDRNARLSAAYAGLEDRKRMLQQRAAELFSAKRQLESTLNAVGTGVITTDKNGNVLYLNSVAEKKTGWRLHDAQGQAISTVFVAQDPVTHEKVSSSIEKVLFLGGAVESAARCHLLNKDGHIFSIEDSASPMLDSLQKPGGAVLIFRDINDTQDNARNIIFQDDHDLLTGLLNQSEFDRRIELALELREADYALVYLDLDQFQTINDTCGHAAGDELLRRITGLLQMSAGPNDSLAWLGGDEFGILLGSCTTSEALEFTQQLSKLISEFHFTWEEHVFPMSASIGLVHGHANQHRYVNCTELQRIAAAACCSAKELGRNGIHVYDPTDEELNRQLNRMEWHTKIQDALAESRFVLYKQKITSLTADLPYTEHVEFLLRLIDKDGSVIPPKVFITNAERFGLMNKIDQWVIQTAMAYIAEHAHRSTSLYAINLSGDTLNDEDAVQFIFDQLQTYHLSGKNICFEITEEVANTNVLNTRIFIEALHVLGCKFALDGFGSGLPACSHLRQLPVDFIKIDGCFIRNMVDDAIDATMASAINDIGHVLGLKTIAVHVEDDDILARLNAMGVDYAQGYRIGHPEPITMNAVLH